MNGTMHPQPIPWSDELRSTPALLDDPVSHDKVGSLRSSACEHWDFSDYFERFEKRFARSGRAIPVNFRKLVPLHSGVDRSTHLIHSYPAKLLLNIPLFFLNCSQLSQSSGRVLDPFCGTGTVLVEALLAGRGAIGADANPLARLIARVKTTPLDQDDIESAYERVMAHYAKAEPLSFSPIIDPDLWFEPAAKRQLGQLLQAVRETTDGAVGQFMEVCFSSCVRKMSRADPRLSVPVRLPTSTTTDVPGSRTKLRNLFRQVVAQNKARMGTLSAFSEATRQTVEILRDARELTSISDRDKSVDLVITSPPYGGAQKYIRASSLSIGWLGLAPDNKLRNLEREVIGREHFAKAEYQELTFPDISGASHILDRIWKINPLRAHIASTYLREMKDALSTAASRLARGSHFILVIGDNTVCGAPFPNGRFLRTVLESCNLSLRFALVDDIRSRGLMTKRNKTAGIISQERIYVFEK